jgi:hypothetical protein
MTYVALGDRERAFALMEKLYETRNLDLMALRGGAAWEDLGGDPRFDDLLRRFGLAPPN